MAAPYVRNTWYMAAWENEVEDGGLLARTLLDTPQLIYRRESGDGYVMMENRCPHKFAPLSRGKREGDFVVCGYHGLKFNDQGACVLNPFAERPPPNARVRTTPVTARYGGLWFWPGDPSRADEALIPNLAFLDDPTPIYRGKTQMGANFELLTDNLLDLSHVEFIHVKTFQPTGGAFTGKYEAHEGDKGVILSNWWMPDIEPPGWAKPMLPGGAKVDQWIEMEWRAPACMSLLIGIARAGTDRKEVIGAPFLNPHIITPETSKGSHYFYTCAPDEGAKQFTLDVFEGEDAPMIESIERNMGGADFWSLKPVILNIDAASVLARRRLMKMRQEEAQALEAVR
jgi:nitrite reductase/ring-hydroxylating ferredoxin subunit